MSNSTHRKRLARRYAQTAGLPYQEALNRVVTAAAAGRLPAHLDPDGMAAALAVLLADPVLDRPSLSPAPDAADETRAGADRPGFDPDRVVVCFTEQTDPIPARHPWDSTPPVRTRTWTHRGPCRLGLGYHPAWKHPANNRYDGYWYLRRALEWADGLPEFDDLTPLVEPLLTRAEVTEYEIPVSPEELAAAREIIDEATAYWVLCDYIDDEPGEDQILGAMAESAPSFYGMCCRSDRDPTGWLPTG